jgi:hypothetical protein
MLRRPKHSKNEAVVPKEEERRRTICGRQRSVGGGSSFSSSVCPLRAISQKLHTCLLSRLIKQAVASGTNFHPITKSNCKQTENQNISCLNHIITVITMNLSKLPSSNNTKKFQNSMVNGASVVPTSRK